MIAFLLGGLVLIGFLPVSTGESVPTILLSVLVNLAICAIAISKGKVVMGVVGVLVPIVGLIGAIRLAKPHSPWRGRASTPRAARSSRRRWPATSGTRARYQRFQDQVAGAPTALEPPSKADG